MQLLVPEERAVFMREQASSLYDVSPYFLGKILADLPFSILDSVVLSVIVYWAIGFNTYDAAKFFTFCINIQSTCSVWAYGS